MRDAHGNRSFAPTPSPVVREANPAPAPRPESRRVETEGGLRPAFVLAALLVILVGGAYLLLPSPTVAAAHPRDDAATKRALYLGVLKIEAYRKLNGMTPFEVEVANIRRKDGYAYERLDDRYYVLTFREPDGTTMAFDSHVPIERHFGPPEAILGDGSRP